MANINLTITSDFLVTDSFLNQLISAINSKTDARIEKTFNPNLSFTENFRMVHTLVGDTELVLDELVVHKNETKGRIVVTGNGISTLLIPVSWVKENGGLFNIQAGFRNIIDLEFESGKVFYTIK